MSLFNKKSSSDFDEPQSNAAGKNKVSLLILLVLGGVFAYLYFFTSLIVSHETAAPKPSAAPPEVKQSMPTRPAEQGAAAVVDAKKPEGAAAAPAAAPAAKPAAPPLAKPAAPPVAAKPAAPAAAVAAKPAPAPKAQPAAAKTAPPPAPAATKKEAVKPAPTAAKAAPLPAVAAKKPAEKKTVIYTIAISELPAGAEVATAEAKLAKHGVKPVLKQVSQKGRIMNRLFVNSFSDYDAYANSLEALKQSTKSAFGIEKDGKYYVYAGSYSSAALALKEKTRLLSKGVKVEIQKAVIPGTTVKITAGSFKTKAEAGKAAAALSKAGLAARVIPKGK